MLPARCYRKCNSFIRESQRRIGHCLEGAAFVQQQPAGIKNVPATPPTSTQEPAVDNKLFELSNHLGNVLVTISDKRLGIYPGNDGIVDYYVPEVMSAMDYYPFGMLQTGRQYAVGEGYRYGLNGKENDNEVKGTGNQQDYGMRIYDPRLGKFLSVDPLTSDYPWYTPYQFAGNKPIQFIDVDGLEEAAPKYICCAPPTNNDRIKNPLSYIGEMKLPKAKPRVQFLIPWTWEEMRQFKADHGPLWTMKMLTSIFVPATKLTKLGSGTRLVVSYLLNSSIDASFDVIGQLSSNGFDFEKVDWIDVGTNFLPEIKGKWGIVLTAVYKNVIEASADYTLDKDEGGGFSTILGEKDLTEAGLEALVGTVVDGVYGVANQKLKQAFIEAKLDKKSIEERMTRVIEAQMNTIKEMIKANSQDAAKFLNNGKVTNE